MLLGESHHALAVGIVLVGLFAAFVNERLKPDVAVMLAVSALLVLGVLSAKDVTGVFGNSAPITIACLFVISGALSKTGCVDRLGEWLGELAGSSERRLLLALLLVCLVVSPFIDNTPMVMVMIPAVIAVAGRYAIAPSRLLIPLSYATILGGTITLVGTSTNILVDGVARTHGLAPFSMFEISAPAILMALACSTFIFLFARRLLPVRETLTQQFVGSGDRLFMTELFVPPASDLIGKTLKEARLAGAAVQVLNLWRGERELANPDPATRIEAGDRIVVHSRSDAMMDLRSTDLVGLQATAHDLETLRRRDVVMVEALVGQTSRYIQRPVRDLDLLARYGVHLVALGDGLSPWLMLSLIILATSLATEFLSNNAVAVLFTPVVISVAQQLGVDPRPFVVGVMFAASCSFATPIGYQTNTLVYSAGNYRFADFARLGVPMNILTWLLASLLIPLFWPLHG